jgi:hypothetical protein
MIVPATITRPAIIPIRRPQFTFTTTGSSPGVVVVRGVKVVVLPGVTEGVTPVGSGDGAVVTVGFTGKVVTGTLGVAVVVIAGVVETGVVTTGVAGLDAKTAKSVK